MSARRIIPENRAESLESLKWSESQINTYLKESDDDSSDHDEGWVQDRPQEQRDGQTAVNGEFLNVWLFS